MIPELANHLWQSTLFAAAVGLLTLVLRRNRAAVRHALWVAASVKFLIPFSLLIAVGNQFELRKAPVAQPQVSFVPQVAFVMGELSHPFASPSAAPLASVPDSVHKWPSRIPAVLFSLWLCGFAANGVAWWRRWRRVRAALRATSPLPLNPLTQGLPIPVMSSPTQLEPGIFGIRNPVLLLPDGITERLTPAQLQAILAHELCHVRRRDNLTAAVHMLVEALFWFHPLVWWIQARLVEERERACDEEVLRIVGDPQDYAEGILNVCKFYLESPLVCVSGVTGSNLKRRVEAIMIGIDAHRLNFGKKLLLTVAGVLAVTAPLVVGVLNPPMVRGQSQSAQQNITGTWQGALKANGPNGSVDLRTVLKISRADDESLKGVFYFIDEDATPFNTTSITFKGSTVKLSITPLDLTFEGTLSGDGDMIKGNWKQGGPALALNLVRATTETAWTIPDPPPLPENMPATANPEFVVATIKPSLPGAPRGGYGIRGQDVTTTNVNVNWMIKLAYNVHARQIEGGPAWLDSEKYDTVGRPDTPGQPNRDQMKLMIRKLLTDRFQLKFHIEKRELPVYAVVVLKTGAKLTVSAGDPNAFPGIGFGLAPGVITLTGRNTGLNGMVNGLQSNILDKPVVDQTGLTGRYDFSLKFTPDANQFAAFGAGAPGNTTDPDAPPDIFTAFQQQLGLKLESTKALVDVMVIEKIERPSEN